MSAINMPLKNKKSNPELKKSKKKGQTSFLHLHFLKIKAFFIRYVKTFIF